MGIFNKWFGKQTKKDQSSSNSKNSVYHNFSDYDFPEIEFRPLYNQMVDMLAVIADIGRKLDEVNMPFQDLGFFYTQLFEKEVFKAPLVFNWKDKGFSVFFIYSKEDARIYNILKEIALKTNYPNTIYFSKFDIRKIVRKSKDFPEFMLSDLSYQEKTEAEGEFAMWWSEEGDKSFTKSKTKEYLDIIYKSIHGYESIFFGQFLLDINFKGIEKFQKVKMPDAESSFVIKAPEYMDMVVSVSQEKGMRFQFPKDKASRKYREVFLKHLSQYFRKYNEILRNNKIPKKIILNENGYDWYTFLTNTMEREELNNPNNDEIVIGRIVLSKNN